MVADCRCRYTIYPQHYTYYSHSGAQCGCKQLVSSVMSGDVVAIRPRDVALVAFCEDRKHAKPAHAFISNIQEKDDWRILSTKGVAPDEAMADTRTDRAVLSIFMQESAPSVVMSVVEAVNEMRGNCFCFVGSDIGEARADVISRAAKDILNSCCDMDGERVFNCQLFGLHTVRSKSALTDILEDAQRWVDGSWVLVPFPLDPYPADACRKRTKCYENYTRLEAMTDKFNADRLGFKLSTAQENDAQENDDEVEEAAEEKARPPPRKKLARAKAKSSSSSSRSRLTPTQPITLPPARLTAAGKVVLPPTSKAPQPQSCRVVRPWETLKFDLTNWKHTLDTYGVDDSASKELWLLAQMSDEGARSANGVIANLLKKEQDAVTIVNPSAFVHSCCLAARHQLTS
jgi:hypothetical protein